MTKESKHAIFKYEESDTSLINELAEFIDDNAERIFQFFGVKTQVKPIIRIIPTKIEFDKQFIRDHSWAGPDYQCEKWLRGYAKNQTITYLSIHDYKNTTHAFKKANYHRALENYKKTLLHEFVHFVNILFITENNCPQYTAKYLSEGLASCLSGQREHKKMTFDCTLNEVLYKERESKKNYYDNWDLVTRFLLENYDHDFIIELIKDHDKANKFLETELYDRVNNFYNNENE